jgi:hypothetical protein
VSRHLAKNHESRNSAGQQNHNGDDRFSKKKRAPVENGVADLIQIDFDDADDCPIVPDWDQGDSVTRGIFR